MRVLYIASPSHTAASGTAQNVHVTKIVEGLRGYHEIDLWVPRASGGVGLWWESTRAIADGVRAYDAVYVRHCPWFFAAEFTASPERGCLVLEVNATIGLERIAWSEGPTAKNLVLRNMEGRALKKASGIVAVSRVLAAELRRIGVPGERIRVEHNGATAASAVSANTWRRGEPLLIGYVGQNFPWHRTYLLADLIIEADRLGVALAVRLIGPGHGEPPASLPVRLRDCWQPLGTLRHEEVQKRLSQNHLNVLPNTALYGSPVKMFEYLACGVPVALPDQPNIREVVDETSAILFTPGDMAGLARSALEALDCEDRARGLAEKATSLVKETYNWSAISRRIALHIEEFCS